MNIIGLKHTNQLFFQVVKKFTWHLLVSTFFIIGLYSTGLYAGGFHAESENQPETHKITISEHEFEPWTFTAHPGDIIEITNRAKISHSIYIITETGEIINIDEKLYVQIPGTTVKWKVPASGEFTLKCWIHPSINATLVVP